MLNERELHFEN